MKSEGLWFSDYNKKYTSNETSLYTAYDVPAAQFLEQHYPTIQNELKTVWETTDTDAFGAYDSFDDKQYPPRSWKKMVFKVWGVCNSTVGQKYPVTAALLAQIPHLLSGYVTRIAPGAVIKPHCGETNAHLRIHLGLHVPDVPPSVCGMQIGGKTVGWKNGEAFAFLDAHEHHVWNKSKHYRYILIVDVLRPEFVPRKSFVYARVIVSQLVYFSLSLLRVPHLDKIPPGLLSTITYVLYLPIVVTTWFGNKLGLFKL